MRLRVGLATVLAYGLAMGAMPAMAQDNVVYIGTSMFGDQEVGHKGAGEDASGDFSAELDLANGRMCFTAEVEGLDEVTAVHLHEGAVGKNGPMVLLLQLSGDDGEDVCIDADPELLKKVARKKAGYYINVHTVAYPDGAIRGQLKE